MLSEIIVCNSVAYYRESIGLSINELATIIGVSPSTIISWEKGKNNPSINNVILLCNFFDIKMDDLVYLDE